MNYKTNWQFAWQQKYFKQQIIIGFIILLIVLAFFPFFFNYIEKKEGTLLNDFVLDYIPSYNLSIAIFTTIWSMGLLLVIRCVQQPKILLLFLWGFILLSISRFISISLLPLQPPNGLIELKDPLSNSFYGTKFITKDLFYSGHTATQYLMFLCLQKKWDKIVTLASTLAIGIMVLIQHVHYTIDVVFALPITYMVFILTKKIVSPSLKGLS